MFERFSTKCADFYSSITPNPLYHNEDVESFENNKQRNRSGPSFMNFKSNIEISQSSKSQKKKKKKKSKKRTGKDAQKNKLQHGIKKSLQEKKDEYIQQPSVALQMWDTAGKERLVSESTGLTSRHGDAFFRHANVAILIYDATSSRSFLQLIKWYSELLERIARVQCMDRNTEFDVETRRKMMRLLKRKFPVLVVATKLDMLLAEEASRLANKKTVPQRSVIGLNTFTGINTYYEYGDVNSGKFRYGSHADLKSIDEMDDNVDAITSNDGEKKALSYGLEGHSWAMDKSYMNYIRIAEDECFPDRNMVLRWCRRNGLQMVEVSALENVGIDVAVDSAVKLALNEINEQKKIEASINKYSSGSSQYTNKSDDLYQTRVQDDECAFCQFLVRRIRRYWEL